MKQSLSPTNVRLEIVRRKLADIEVELAGVKAHMSQLPNWSVQCKTLDKVIRHLRKWREDS